MPSTTYRAKNSKTIIWSWAVFAGILLLYLLLRGFAWRSTVLLEDTDSLAYLDNIKVFLSFDPDQIYDLGPDHTPFYPFFGALFNLPGSAVWSIETGARMASLFFSALLFVAVLGIGQQITRRLETTLGLLILSFSPALISLSFAILTEPSYIATVYLGLWLFWTQYKKPQLWQGALLGLIFGLAFLNRIEGLLYLAAIPLLQGAYLLWHRYGRTRKEHTTIGTRPFMAWSLVFVVCFLTLAVPQVWRVSDKMGTFAINGRQVWSIVLNRPDGKSDNAKLFGLDYSPAEYNIRYIQSHPETLRQLSQTGSSISILDYIKTAARNFNELYNEKLGALIGPLALIFFGFGLMALLRHKRGFDAFLILAFTAVNLVAPLLHNVIPRHVLIIAPLIFLTAGIGIVSLTRQLSEDPTKTGPPTLPALLLLILLGAWASPLMSALSPPERNAEYSPNELEEPIAIIKDVTQQELGHAPIIAAQRGYLAYFVGGEQRYLPYTDYKGLVRYCKLNHVDFVYLKRARLLEYPFMPSFDQKAAADFVLLYSAQGKDKSDSVALYRFQHRSAESRTDTEEVHGPH